MRAIRFEAFGGTDKLVPCEIPAPEPGPGQLLIRVRAASVNPADIKFRQGAVPFFIKPRLPFVPGHDVAGEVVAVGPGVSRFRVGDSVLGLLALDKGGGCAELAVLDDAAAAHKPASLTYEEAATLPVCGLCALQGLRDHARLTRGESVAVNGAAGGVGTMTVQIARALGATVTAVTGPASTDLARSMGAENVVDYTKVDFTDGGERYDVIFDAVAKRSYSECGRALKPGGRFVMVVPSPGMMLWMALLPLAGPLSRGKRVKFLLARGNAADLAFLCELADQGKLRPVIDRVLPWAEIGAAHAHVETEHAHGKVILSVAG